MYAYGGTIRFEDIKTASTGQPINPYRYIDAGDVSFNPTKVGNLVHVIEEDVDDHVVGIVVMRSAGKETRATIDNIKSDPDWFRHV